MINTLAAQIVLKYKSNAKFRKTVDNSATPMHTMLKECGYLPRESIDMLLNDAHDEREKLFVILTEECSITV